jgi:hypothetical protein
MKKLSVLLLGLFFGLIIQAQKVNDPNAEVREAKAYHGIKVSNAFDVYLTQSMTEEAVAVSASETKYRDKIKVEVKDGILNVWYDNEGKWGTGNKKLKAYISFKQIDQLTINGACDVYISGILKSKDLTIKLTGASDLKGTSGGGKLEIEGELNIDLNGASDMNLTGTAEKLSIEASGASSFKGFEFVTNYCDAHASGASDITITVNKELSAHATGASDVHYKGAGVIRDIKTSGASNVSKRG